MTRWITVSDEKDCSIIHVDHERYLRDKQPPTDNNQDKIVPVEVDVDVLRVLRINEVC